jgi:hypothetical protein
MCAWLADLYEEDEEKITSGSAQGIRDFGVVQELANLPLAKCQLMGAGRRTVYVAFVGVSGQTVFLLRLPSSYS